MQKDIQNLNILSEINYIKWKMFPYKMNAIGDEKTAINNNNINNSTTAATITTTNSSDVVQWPLNHSAYQNINTDNVDWAALAQQWIQLKTIPSLLDIPTMPVASQLQQQQQQQYSKASFEEKGEAPMEVEKDDDESYNVDFCNSSSSMADPKSWNLLTNQPNWRKKNNITDPVWTTDQHPQQPWTTPHQQNFNQINKQSLLPNPINFNDNDNHLLGVQLQSENRHTNVWSTGTTITTTNTHSNPMSSLNASHNINSNLNMALNMKHRNIIANTSNDQMELNQTIDAAKRKILPAWIREGLEKMEREKQKTADKTKDPYTKLTKYQFDNNNIKYEQNPIQIKSKFDSESDEENDGIVDKNQSIFNLIKSKPIVIIEKKKTHEEILEELMKTVRTVLTEILLEVTNEEILIIASETVNRKRLKAQTAQILPKTAITSLTNKLGLGMYADSSDNSSDDDDDDDDANEDDNRVSTNDTDALDNKYESDSELKENIKRKKAAFEEKAKSIEAKLAIAEENERLWLEEDKIKIPESRSDKDRLRMTSKRESGEVQHEINTISNVRERKQSRFNNANDVKSSTPYETAINIMKKFDNANNMQLYSIKPSTTSTTTMTTTTTTAIPIPPLSASATASATVTSAINASTNVLPYPNYHHKSDDTASALKRLESKTSSKYDSDSSYDSSTRRKSRSHSRDTSSSYSRHHKRRRRDSRRERTSRSSSGERRHSSHRRRNSSRSSGSHHRSHRQRRSRSRGDEPRSYRKSQSKSRDRSHSSNRHFNNNNKEGRSRSRSLSIDKKASTSGGGGGSSRGSCGRDSSSSNSKYRHRY